MPQLQPGTAPTLPGWVKVFGIIAVILLVVFVLLHLFGHGFGSGMHMSFAEYRTLL